MEIDYLLWDDEPSKTKIEYKQTDNGSFRGTISFEKNNEKNEKIINNTKNMKKLDKELSKLLSAVKK